MFVQIMRLWLRMCLPRDRMFLTQAYKGKTYKHLIRLKIKPLETEIAHDRSHMFYMGLYRENMKNCFV